MVSAAFPANKNRPRGKANRPTCAPHIEHHPQNGPQPVPSRPLAFMTSHLCFPPVRPSARRGSSAACWGLAGAGHAADRLSDTSSASRRTRSVFLAQEVPLAREVPMKVSCQQKCREH